MLKAFALLYSALSGVMSLGLMRVRRCKDLRPKNLPRIAVVVAARDEEENLPALISSLEVQAYPRDRVSFWIVDDESTDETLKIAREAVRRDERFHAIKTNLSSDIASPKKRAIDAAIRKADADWIVTTDADCTPGQFWLQALACYMTPQVGVVLGFSPLSGSNGLIEKLAEGESWSSAALCASAVGLGYPFNAVGRNLAFRRRMYLDLGGYGEGGRMASGDDDLFVQRVVAKSDWKIGFAADADAHVCSKAPSGMDVFKAKIRHMSVGPQYAPGWLVIGLIGNVLFMGLALATVAALLGLVNSRRVMRAWTVKWLCDLIMAISALRVLGDSRRGLLAMVTMSFAPFALWAIWPRSLFGTIEWKGRSFERGRASGSQEDEVETVHTSSPEIEMNADE